MDSTNRYSDTWFKLFLHDIAAADTARETQFLQQFLPMPPYRRLVDLCCGDGRHCEQLSNLGYDVIGLDRDANALSEAQRRCPSIRFHAADMRELKEIGGYYDAIICLWQSFGYFDEATNAQILVQIRDLMAPHGRLILDVYNRDFFSQNLGVRKFVKQGLTITESKFLNGRRLSVTLEYGGVEKDDFEWEVYSQDELLTLARKLGFKEVLSCSQFNPNFVPSPLVPRMQFVLQREDGKRVGEEAQGKDGGD